MKSIAERLMEEIDRGNPWRSEETCRLMKQAAYRIRDLEIRLRMTEQLLVEAKK